MLGCNGQRRSSKSFGRRCGWAFTKGRSCSSSLVDRSSTHANGVVRNGPWPPEECSRCLLTWFDHGWINAHVPPEQLFRWPLNDEALLMDPADETARILESARAHAILADPQTWTNDRAEGFAILNPADHAPSSDFRQLWLGAVTPQ